MVQLLGNVIDKLYFYPECNQTFDGAFEHFGRMYNRFNLWGLWQFFSFFSPPVDTKLQLIAERLCHKWFTRSLIKAEWKGL